MNNLNSVTVKFADSRYNYTTNVSAETTKYDATRYFVGQMFNVTNYPDEQMEKCINIEFTDNNKAMATFETGATSAATNDLILFTDNTRELAELRDEIYLQHINGYNLLNLPDHFQKLYIAAVKAYIKTFPDTDIRYFLPIGSDMAIEFCNLYALDFPKWKQDKDITIHVLSQDGKEVFRGTENACYFKLQRSQGQSADWAFKYGGWKIEPVKDNM